MGRLRAGDTWGRWEETLSHQVVFTRAAPRQAGVSTGPRGGKGHQGYDTLKGKYAPRPSERGGGKVM